SWQRVRARPLSEHMHVLGAERFMEPGGGFWVTTGERSNAATTERLESATAGREMRHPFSAFARLRFASCVVRLHRQDRQGGHHPAIRWGLDILSWPRRG